VFTLINVILRKTSIQCIKLTIPYGFNQIFAFILGNLHVTWIRLMGLDSFEHWSEIFVLYLLFSSFAVVQRTFTISNMFKLQSTFRDVQSISKCTLFTFTFLHNYVTFINYGHYIFFDHLTKKINCTLL